MERDELAAWLLLTTSPGVGRESARKLLAGFGSAEAVLQASRRERAGFCGPAPAAALDQPRDGHAALLEATLRWLNADPDGAHAIIPLGDARYPTALLETADPPLLLYAKGQVALLHAEAVAVVGSRDPTPQGLENARHLSTAIGQAGFTIVSGLALGVDGAAHEGGLATPASTVAVVGTGLDVVYPRRHQALAQRIAAHGLIVSEYALGAPPLAAHFPPRNRIIAGLTRGTLVVEAALQSGSLITARMALEAGRDVFAVPGSIHAPQSRGCHALIKQGAKLVETAQDILDELKLPTPKALAADAASEPAAPNPLLDALGFDPVTLDALVARTGWSAAELSTRLLDLELDGRVARLPGQQFQRIGRA